MTTKTQDEIIADAINNMTSKVSNVLLKEFQKLPEDLQLNVVLIKSAQLLLANVLCHVAADKSELERVIELQGEEMKELTTTCAVIGFADKFEQHRH